MSAAAAPLGESDKTAPARWSLLNVLIVLSILVLAAFLASFAATNADLWMRLAAGRMIASGQFPFGHDPFSAHAGATWIHHGWLFDLVLYVLFQKAGGAALVAGKALLVVLTAALLLGIRRPQAVSFGPAIATTLVLLAMIPMLALRSLIASYLLFAILLFLLNRRPDPARRWQFPAAVGIVFLFWVNLDGGFVFGLLLLALSLVGAICQRLVPLGESNGSADSESYKPKTLAITLLVALVACLANPYLIRAFATPTELMPWTLNDDLRRELARDRAFEVLFQSPFSEQYADGIAGWAAAVAFYALMALGLASFAINAGGWQWSRVLIWAMFAWLGASYWRLIPYFAMVAGPALVLNVQAALERRGARRSAAPAPQVVHFLTFLGGLARVGVLIGVLALLALAWPGWLGADARRAASPTRRVAWRAEPEPTQMKLALRLADWYKAGELNETDGRGFHTPWEFGYYCAWFCPDEKSLFDARFTCPAESAVEYLKLRRALLSVSRPRKSDDDQPDVDALARSLRLTHVVANGPDVISSSSLQIGLGPFLFNNPMRWPAWAIVGQGVICGWRDPFDRKPNAFTKLNIDAVQLAMGNHVEPLPPAPADPPRPVAPSAWDRYRQAPAPVPPETYEAGLWLAYRNSIVSRRAVPYFLIQLVTLFGRSAPVGVSDVALQVLMHLPEVEQRRTEALKGPWQFSPDGRIARAATLLAIRTARRATRINPDQPGAYAWLTQAYGEFETDPVLQPYQQITAARQALTRLTVMASERRPDPFEELQLQSTLLDFYERSFVPGTRVKPRDLILEAFERVVDLEAKTLNPAGGSGGPTEQEVKSLEAYVRGRQKLVADLRAKVQAAKDECENASKQPLFHRLRVALSNGLVREALSMLQNSDASERDLSAVITMIELFLFAGEAENANDVLQSDSLNSLEQVPPEVRPQAYSQLQQLKLRTAASLGNYAAGLAAAASIIDSLQQQTREPLAGILADLVAADFDPMHPLARALTLPSWGGLWGRDGQPAVVNRRACVGSFIPLVLNEQQYGDMVVRKAMLALESGDNRVARQTFERAIGPVGPRVMFNDRVLAFLWLEMWSPAPSR